jgi:hypothetical protein
MRDLSEVLNPFLFPRRFERRFELKLRCVLYYIVVCTHNMTTLITIVTPFAAITYFTVEYWFRNQEKQYFNETIGIIGLIFFIILGVTMSLILIYYGFTTSEARADYLQGRYGLGNKKAGMTNSVNGEKGNSDVEIPE